MTDDSGMEVSEETIVISSDISDSLDIVDTPPELLWDDHWTLDDEEWQPEHPLAMI